MATNQSVESLCTFLEHLKNEQADVKKQLHQHVDSAVDGLYSKLVTGLMIWASSNLSCPTTTISKILNASDCESSSISLSTSVVDVPPDEEPPVEEPQKSHDSQSIENVNVKEEILENKSGSQEILDDSFFNADKFCLDDDCDCTDCDVDLEDLMKDEENHDHRSQISETTFGDGSQSPFRTANSSGTSEISHISDTQLQPGTSRVNGTIGLENDDADDSLSEYILVEPTRFEVDMPELNAPNRSHHQETIPSVGEMSRSVQKQPGSRFSRFRIVSLKCQNPDCAELFQTHRALLQHMAEVHRVKLNRCYQRGCGKSFETPMELAAHLLVTHKKIHEFQCSLCLHYFKEHDGLASHMMVYHTEGTFACNHSQCDYIGPFQNVVNRHYTQAHQKFACYFPGCGKSFSYKNVLHTHERWHLGLKPFRCRWPEGCTYASSDRSSIFAHIRVQHFNLPKSKKEQRRLNIVDQRNAKDYIEILGTDQAPLNLPPHIPPSFITSHKPTRMQQLMRNKVYQCKWNGCDYASERRKNIQEHIQLMHSRHKTVMVRHSTPV